jgi:hypothetical protein
VNIDGDFPQSGLRNSNGGGVEQAVAGVPAGSRDLRAGRDAARSLPREFRRGRAEFVHSERNFGIQDGAPGCGVLEVGANLGGTRTQRKRAGKKNRFRAANGFFGDNLAGIGMEALDSGQRGEEREKKTDRGGRPKFFQASAESLPTISALPQTPTDWSRFSPPLK